jgi:hypothetical protein
MSATGMNHEGALSRKTRKVATRAATVSVAGLFTRRVYPAG